ncbi:hypothetical protein BDY19DRAFT_988823 [Irpex rosettiformis]|uniref:Uncharacterized protein n=1 Tax=Irpex rosettiformis TaxID=378272 RepID=A0ACB8UL22_9APHY|nr:hypothetical protein BDY19DRAFT_988823 [Irpex rosettiformis]
MLGHASRRADYHPFASVLQAAASRAWTRTRPASTRAVHRTTSQKQSFSVKLGVLYGGECSNSRGLRTGLGNCTVPASLPEHIATTPTTDYSQADPFKLLEDSNNPDYNALLEENHTSNSSTNALSTHDAPSFSVLSKPVLAVSKNATAKGGSSQGIDGRKLDQVPIHPAHDLDPCSIVTSEPAHEDTWMLEVDHAWNTLSTDLGQEVPCVMQSTSGTEGMESFSKPPLLPPARRDSNTNKGNSVPLETNSALSLYKNLVILSASPLLPSATKIDRLNGLLHFHHHHPDLHSTDSYNLLVSLAIAIGQFRVAATLLRSMSHSGIPGNFETRKLAVRFWLRRGEWTRVWIRETASGHPKLPLPLWLEFFETVRIFAPSNLKSSWAVHQAYRRDCEVAISSRFSLLMRHRPTLTAAELAVLPPRAAFYLLRWMIQRGQQTEALNLTAEYLQLLPKTLPRSYHRYCTDIMNLHLKTRAGKVREIRPMLRELLAFHPELRPDSRTLQLVLGALRTQHGSSVVLDRVRRRFQEEWGEDIADERILSFVADRARRDRYPRVLKKVIQEYDRRREASQPRAWLPSFLQPRRIDDRQPHKVIYYNHQKEDRRWEFYRQCLLELEKKQWRKKREVKS